MIEHDLKCHSEPFEGILSGKKTHEVRVNDRNFKVGDILRLREWIPITGTYSSLATGRYTGRECRVEVTYITWAGTYGLSTSTCVMSVKAEQKSTEEVRRTGAGIGAAVGAAVREFLRPDTTHRESKQVKK